MQQDTPSDFKKQDGTDFQDGGQIDFHAHSGHVTSYEEGAALAAQDAKRTNAHEERALTPHEQVKQIGEFLAQYRTEEIKGPHRNPYEYELIS